MAEQDDEFGVFADILNIDDDPLMADNAVAFTDDTANKAPIVYDVFQTKSFRPEMSDQEIQALYGTEAMPVFEWAKKIKTGERTYTPGDDYDESMMEKYKNFGQLPPGYLSAQEIMAQRALQGSAGQLGMSLGTSIGSELASPYATGDTLDRITSGILKTGQTTGVEAANLARFSELSDDTQSALRSFNLDDNYIRELSSPDVADATGNRALFDQGLKDKTIIKPPGSDAYVPTDKFGQTVQRSYNQQFGDEVTGFPDSFDPTRPVPIDSVVNTATQQTTLGKVTDRLNPFTDAGSQNVTASGVGAGVNFVARVASGQDVDEAAKSAADAGLIQYATTALLAATPLAPFSTIIGGVVGGFVGRVICNELMRQGIMDRKQVILDYKFTRDYLTPTHVSGYHVWAVWMVKQMRKGRFVNLWAHIAGHRANEIAYIYGERDKPDYLGKVYRKILEPICWTVGLFCKETDWSILYKTKEI